jgi:hypothetical protein
MPAIQIGGRWRIKKSVLESDDHLLRTILYVISVLWAND